MRQRKIIRTTLGELILAVTDEVMPIIRNPSGVESGVAAALRNEKNSSSFLLIFSSEPIWSRSNATVVGKSNT